MAVRTDLLPEELTETQEIVVKSILGNFAEGLQANGPQRRMRQPKPAKDIDGFVELVGRVIAEQQNSEQIPLENRVKFLEDFGPDDIRTEIISFSMVRRVPFSFSAGQHFNQRVREVKPHVRGIEDDPTRPGYKVITLGQRFENEILLVCWAKTNKQANRRARWLEDTLRNWTWYIRYEGIEDFYFLSQDEDITLVLDGTDNKLVGRPLRYWVKTQRVSHVLEPTIRRIVVEYGLGQTSTTEQ